MEALHTTKTAAPEIQRSAAEKSGLTILSGVGLVDVDDSKLTGTLAGPWDGRSWATEVALRPVLTTLESVSCGRATWCVAVDSYAGRALAVVGDGKRWSAEPTVGVLARL